MNVLITSAARKVPLVRAFQRAWKGEGAVIAGDIDPKAAALYAADSAVLLPRSDAPGFVDEVLELCLARGISLVVPTRDEELPVFASAKPRFAAAGVRVHVSDFSAVRQCQDKVSFHRFCADHGIPVPTCFTAPTPEDLPLFARPRFGKGGRGAYAVRTVEALRATDPEETIYTSIIQAPEYTVDVFVARASGLADAVPRERVHVVGGESQISRTVEAPLLVDLATDLVGALALEGHVTVQAFQQGDDVAFIEVNPRFGGAAALGFEAGLRSPEWLLQELRGERPGLRPGTYTRDLVMLRHSADMFVRWEGGVPQL